MVSIIVPVYNVEKYLGKCIDSIVNQTYKNIEVILINDGSTDNSGKICDQFAENDPRIRVLHQSNSGVSHARNIGIGAANGHFIEFVDSDDCVEHDITERLLSAMGDEAQLAVCGYKAVTTCEDIHLCPIEGRYKRSEFILYFPKLFKQELINAIWNKMYSADTIKNSNLRFAENICVGEDLLFNLEYIKNCVCISLIKAPLYVYQNTDSSSLTLGFKKDLYQNQKLLFEKTIEYLQENGIYTNENKKYLEMLYADKIIWCLENLFHKDCVCSIRAKRREIKEIVNDISARNDLADFHNGSTHKRFLGFLIRNKLNGCIYCDLRITMFLSKNVRPLLKQQKYLEM
jgi:glycosyltransferase involved in cell wall biosynthesis